MIEELKKLNIITPTGRINRCAEKILNKNIKTRNIIFNRTIFLPIDSTTFKERIYCIINNITSTPKCKNCNTTLTFQYNFTKYRVYCSRQCANSDIDYLKGKENTIQEKYGETNVFKVQQIKDKIQNTILKKYNVKNISQNSDIKKKKKETKLKKYGNEKYNNIQQMKQTCLNRYNVTTANHVHISIDSLNKLNDKEWLIEQHYNLQKTLTRIAEELSVGDCMVDRYLHEHGLHTQMFSHSQGEKEVDAFINDLDINTIQNNRQLIAPSELDIYIPSHNLAIEYCGLYWHSDIHKPKNYHANKLHACHRKGIRLLTIFEDEWQNKQDIVKSKIKQLLNLNTNRIYARKTVVVPISPKQKRVFLDQYHIQGSGPGSVTYGLLYENELIACLSFIKQDNTFTLNRYATSTNVVGGFSKLLKYFQRNHSYEKIITFADMRWSDGNLYDKTGFTLDGIVNPTYEYIIDNKRLHRSRFMRRHLPKWLGEAFDPNLTEFQNCDNAGILRIWNCGLKRYIML